MGGKDIKIVMNFVPRRQLIKGMNKIYKNVNNKHNFEIVIHNNV